MAVDPSKAPATNFRGVGLIVGLAGIQTPGRFSVHDSLSHNSLSKEAGRETVPRYVFSFVDDTFGRIGASAAGLDTAGG